eukprot:4324071-Alexandrium_andersonii.AAC.1
MRECSCSSRMDSVRPPRARRTFMFSRTEGAHVGMRVARSSRPSTLGGRARPSFSSRAREFNASGESALGRANNLSHALA